MAPDASSGSLESSERAALQRLLHAAERGAFDIVIMDLIDRTSRGGIFEFADICQRFLRFDVTPLWATDRDINLTPQTGQLIVAAKAWDAYQEKEAIMRRFRRKRQDRIADGHLDRATIPYGYQWADAERTAWEPDETTAPIVRRIFHEIATGQSATGLAKQLTETGVPTPGADEGSPTQPPALSWS
jgi:site-specific DNA recombinase